MMMRLVTERRVTSVAWIHPVAMLGRAGRATFSQAPCCSLTRKASGWPNLLGLAMVAMGGAPGEGKMPTELRLALATTNGPPLMKRAVSARRGEHRGGTRRPVPDWDEPDAPAVPDASTGGAAVSASGAGVAGTSTGAASGMVVVPSA